MKSRHQRVSWVGRGIDDWGVFTYRTSMKVGWSMRERARSEAKKRCAYHYIGQAEPSLANVRGNQGRHGALAKVDMEIGWRGHRDLRKRRHMVWLDDG